MGLATCIIISMVTGKKLPSAAGHLYIPPSNAMYALCFGMLHIMLAYEKRKKIYIIGPSQAETHTFCYHLAQAM